MAVDNFVESLLESLGGLCEGERAGRLLKGVQEI
jgi:hypothetical protein